MEFQDSKQKYVARSLQSNHGNKLQLVCSSGEIQSTVLVSGGLYFSRYVEVINLHKLNTSRDIVGVLKVIFARQGILEQLRFGNGPQFNSAEFAQFAKEWVLHHNTIKYLFPHLITPSIPFVRFQV